MKRGGKMPNYGLTNFLILTKAIIVADFFYQTYRYITIIIFKTHVMETQNDLKELVKQKYSEIALQEKETNESSCCGSGCCSTEVYNICLLYTSDAADEE